MSTMRPSSELLDICTDLRHRNVSDKLDVLSGGHGTILFFEDTDGAYGNRALK